MSLKCPSLHTNMTYFSENAAVVSDERGERFHQDIVKIENCNKGK